MSQTLDTKFLFESGVGKKAEQAVTELGFEVKTLRGIDVRMPDPQILKIAEEERRVVVTMDKDFGSWYIVLYKVTAECFCCEWTTRTVKRKRRQCVQSFFNMAMNCLAVFPCIKTAS